jgi:DNA-binding SARP family transcriptional activator
LEPRWPETAAGPARGSYAARVEVLVIGPVEARLTGASVDLGTPKQRALLCALALSTGRPVALDTIVDLLWGADPPPGVAGTLQSYVSNLRRVLEPTRQRRRPAEVLVTVAPGYALRIAAEATDAGCFVAMVGAQHRLLAGTPLIGTSELSRDELAEAITTLNEALGLWRGRPYAELDDAPDAVAERARLEDLRLLALEDRAVASLALGHHATVAAELEALTAAHPLRERFWGLRAVALARSGRQADALESLSTVRTVLADELGLEPGVELRELQTAVLRQDPLLAWTEPPASRPTGAVIPERRSRTDNTATTVSAQPAPLVGRGPELSALEDLLDKADAGVASYVTLVGEPGIGKSRLAEELGHRARLRGWRTVFGRCSQDDGAPPFWPWMAVLSGLGNALPTIVAQAGDDGARFRAWEQIFGIIQGATRDEPVLLVMEDLHWADSCSLGALRLVVEAMTDERLLVVATRRTHPEPSGPLADLGETAARRHALLLELTGLGAEESAEVAQQVIGARPSRNESTALRERTEGNPFFIVEYARLAGHRGDLGGLLAEENPPTAVQDVLKRRISRLPDATVDALRTAAVVGRQFDASTLAMAAGLDEDDLLDVVEPAQAAGLVAEDGIDRFVFSHALVVDTLLAGLRASRRSRVHARVAEALTGAGQDTELARHWLAAGPSHADRAWRAAVAAAEQSSRLHAHDRASQLLVAALDRMALDDTATLQDRYDVLLHVIDAYRWTGMWPELTASVERAVAVADEIGDVELLARAAISTNHGALWQSARFGEEHVGVVAALRRSLEELPAGDGELRCRVLLALGNESYYVAPYAERLALIDEAIAMAERIGDARLLLETHQTAFVALWACQTGERRLAHATAALELAVSLGDERAAVVCGALRCVVLSELGRPGELFDAVESVRAEAVRLRLPYGLIVLDGLVLPWLAMAGRFEECDGLLEGIRQLDAQMSLEHSGDAMGSAMLSQLRWQGREKDLVPVVADLADGPFPLESTIVCTMWRAGDHEGARTWAAGIDFDLDHDTWFTMFAWGHAAEAALYLEDEALGLDVYARMAPYAGQSVRAGSVLASGPVDLYLALAARAAGKTEVAQAHAERALELCATWEIPLAAEWLTDLRAAYAF